MKRKRFFITGATSGIGKCLAQHLHKNNNFIFGCGKSEKKVGELQKEFGPAGEIFKWDLSQVPNALHNTLLNTEPFDGLIFCAGVAPVVPFQTCSNEILLETMTINFFSVYSILRHFIKARLLAEPCSIVFMSSFAAKRPSKGQSAYSASKIALESLMKTLIQEYSYKKKWRFNSIEPGLINTEMAERAKMIVDQDHIDNYLKSYPFGYGKPEEVVNLVSFLLDFEKSGYINGAIVSADGGANHVTRL